MKKAKWLVVILIATFIGMGVCYAQEEEEEKGHVYTMSTYKISFKDFEEFIDVMEQFKEVWMENDFILSQKLMSHLWGPDWSVIVVTEYTDLSSIEKAQKRSKELIKEKFTDEEKLKELTQTYQEMIVGHTDAIVKEVPSLTK